MRFDFKRFEDYYLEQFITKTRRQVAARQAAENGKKLAGEDLTNGYLDGKKHDQTMRDLDVRRVEAKQAFRPILAEFNKAAKEFGESQLSIDMNACAAIAPVLEMMGSNDADYMALSKKYDNYGQLRMIANAALRNGAKTYGNTLNAALDAVVANVGEVFGGGMGASAEKGVLGQLEGWESALYMKLDKVKKSVTEVNYVTGVEERPRTAFENLFLGGLESKAYGE